MSATVPLSILELEKSKRLEAEEAAAQAKRELAAAVARSQSADAVIARVLGKMKIPNHVAEGAKNLDAVDRLDYVLGRSGDWISPVIEKAQPLSDEEKAARAASPRRYN